MEWDEVRRIFPDQYVKIKILKFRMEGNRKFIEDMAIIRNITDPLEATRELVKSRDDTLVYHTGNKDIFVEIRPRSYRMFA